MPKLTATALTEPGIERMKAAPAGERLERPDRLAPGLVLRITQTGAKSWIVRYRVDGAPGKIALGAWPAISVAEAREAARQVREQAFAGIDPREARTAAQATAKQQAQAEAEANKTFADIAEGYIQRDLGRLAQAKELESLLRREIIPDLGKIRVADFRRRDAVRLLDRLVDDGRSAVAAKAHWLVTRVFRWAADRDEIEINPIAGLKSPAKPTARDRTLTHDEIRTLWAAWGKHGYPFGGLQRFLLMTAARRSEAAAMTWAELDDPEAPTTWTLPGGRSKNGREHVLPLSQPARALLAGLPRGDGPFVFSTTEGARPVSGFSKAKATTDVYAAKLRADAEAEPIAPWTWHDLRRTCRSELARLGIPDEVGERILNHAGDPLVRTYNVHRYQSEMADALERWGKELLRIVGEREEPDNVTRLKAAS